MATAKQGAVKRLNMAERAEQQMNIFFPDMPSCWVWRRKTNNGFTTIPRTLPIAMQAIDVQSKGQPAGHTLFGLWARSPDHPFIIIDNPATFASEAGFMGERAVDTWRRRMKSLRDLHFIATRTGTTGEFHYVLLLNPNAAMEHMRRVGQIQDTLYARFIERVSDIGAYKEIEDVREFLDQPRPSSPAAPQQASPANAA